MIETKNAAAASDVATRINLIKNKETETEKMLMSMNVTIDDEINLNNFKRKQNDWWYLKDINMQNKYEKKIHKLNIYWYYFIRRIIIY